MADFIIGADLGQARDHTALVVLEVTAVDTGKTKQVLGYGGYDPYNRTVPVLENHYSARHLERLALGTPYPRQVARIKELFDHLSTLNALVGHGVLQSKKAEVELVVDATGVGAPVVDMLKQANLPLTAVTITAGDTVSRDGGHYRVPKRDLVTTVQVCLQAERLKIARSLPEAQTLIDELLAFKVSINTRGHASFGNDVGSWREAPHDDLVLATALACWRGENTPPPPERRQPRSFSQMTY